jgi:hypothetical protein
MGNQEIKLADPLIPFLKSQIPNHIEENQYPAKTAHPLLSS